MTQSFKDNRIDPNKGQSMGTLRELAKTFIQEKTGRYEEDDKQYGGSSMSWTEYELTLYGKWEGQKLLPQVKCKIFYETRTFEITVKE